MRMGIGALLLAVSASVAAQTATSPAPKLDVKTIPPRPDDVATIDGMVKAYYEVVSGPKGQPRDWARDRTLYIKDIRFVPVDVAKDGTIVPRIVDHQTFAERPLASRRKASSRTRSTASRSASDRSRTSGALTSRGARRTDP